MKHEKVISRIDGTRVKITVRLNCRRGHDSYNYSAKVEYCPPGGRGWLSITDDVYNEFIRSDPKGRIDPIKNRQFNHLTMAEIWEVKLELWDKLKPEAD